MAERIDVDGDTSVHIEALQDMFRPIATALDLGLPPYPPTSLAYAVTREGAARHIRLEPSARFLEWRDAVVSLIEAQKRIPPVAPSDYRPT